MDPYRDDHASVGAKRAVLYLQGMAGEGARLTARRCVPDLEGLVLARGDDELTVGLKSTGRHWPSCRERV